MSSLPGGDDIDFSRLPNFAKGLTRREKYGYTSYRALKRVLDIIVSLLCIVVFGPLMLVISLAIVLRDGFPVIFKQVRIGEDGKEFKIFKFRSMVLNADKVLEKLLAENPAIREEFERTYKLAKDPRILPFGGFLRKSSLDELPQFFNVLRGEMSIVGPRPVVPKELSKYGDQVDIYCAMKPGCAGLWQCSGRSETSYEERILLDQLYFKVASMRNDVKILIMTFVSILRREGAK